MRSVITIDGKSVILNMADFEEEIQVDDLTRINYENIYGDAVTVSAVLNRFGIVQAEAEEKLSESKLSLEIFESSLRKQWRRDAIENGGKFKIEKDGEQIKLTENSLDEAVILSGAWRIKKKNVIKAQSDLSKISAIYWGIQSKDKKLNNLLAGVTEKELWSELIEGKINGLIIKKMKGITEKKHRTRELNH